MLGNHRLIIVLAVVAVLVIIASVVIGKRTPIAAPKQQALYEPDEATRAAVNREDIVKIRFEAVYGVYQITDPERINDYRKALSVAIYPKGDPNGLVGGLYVIYKDGSEYNRVFGFLDWSWAFSKEFVKLFNEDCLQDDKIPQIPPPLPPPPPGG